MADWDTLTVTAGIAAFVLFIAVIVWAFLELRRGKEFDSFLNNKPIGRSLWLSMTRGFHHVRILQAIQKETGWIMELQPIGLSYEKDDPTKEIPEPFIAYFPIVKAYASGILEKELETVDLLPFEEIDLPKDPTIIQQYAPIIENFNQMDSILELMKSKHLSVYEAAKQLHGGELSEMSLKQQLQEREALSKMNERLLGMKQQQKIEETQKTKQEKK